MENLEIHVKMSKTFRRRLSIRRRKKERKPRPDCGMHSFILSRLGVYRYTKDTHTYC